MKKAIQLKENLVNDLAKKIKETDSFIIFEYAGLTAEQMFFLRKKLLETKASVKIIKNNILNRALKKDNIVGFETLIGPNAIAFSGSDNVAPLKEIFNLIKDNEFVKIKGSYFENNFLDEQKTMVIASLPGREQLYSMLLSCLTAPIRNFLYALKAVGEKK